MDLPRRQSQQTEYDLGDLLELLVDTVESDTQINPMDTLPADKRKLTLDTRLKLLQYIRQAGDSIRSNKK